MARLQLYTFWRSTCSWRVRWALAIKGIEHEAVEVDLIAGAQNDPAYRAKNPMGYVPALVFEDGRCLAESTAIFEHLEALRPEPPLYPADPWLRARVRQLVALVAAGIQPLQNTSVLDRIDATRGPVAIEWAAHFNARGLEAYEALLAVIHAETGSNGPFSVGDRLTAADVFLVPQVDAARRRYHVDVSKFPRVLAAEAAALATPHAQTAKLVAQPALAR